MVACNHLLLVIAVRLRHCNMSDTTTSINLVGVMSMDVASTYYTCLKMEA